MRRRPALIERTIGLFVLAVICCSGCDANRDGIRLFVAASLADVAQDWQQDYSADGNQLDFHSGGSSTLVQQIAAGAQADIMLSAGPTAVSRLQADGKVARIDSAFLTNRIVIVCRSGMEAPHNVVGLLNPRYERIAVADPAAAPAGEYARAGLIDSGLWSTLADRLIYTADVRATLTAVATGATDIGFVYATDARSEPGLTAMDPGFPAAHYTLVMIAPETPLKVACWDYLHSKGALQLAAARGFQQ